MKSDQSTKVQSDIELLFTEIK